MDEDPTGLKAEGGDDDEDRQKSLSIKVKVRSPCYRASSQDRCTINRSRPSSCRCMDQVAGLGSRAVWEWEAHWHQDSSRLRVGLRC